MNMDRNTVSVPMTGGLYAATALASAKDEHGSSQATESGLGQTLGFVGRAVARTPWAV
jgi:hypothetical protein